MDEEPIINRDEALGLLFNVADVADILRKLYELLGGERKKKRMSKEEFEDWEARVDANLRRSHELAQKAVAERNARRPPGSEPWPDRVPPPVRGATRAERAAWDAQIRWDIRLLRDLAEKAQAELDRKKRESDAA